MKEVEFASAIAPRIKACLDFRESSGFARGTYLSALRSLDRFYSECFPGLETLTKEAVLKWTFERAKRDRAQLWHDSIAVRHLAQYMLSLGTEAYMLPPNMTAKCAKCSPYLFSDNELKAIFHAADTLLAPKGNPFQREAISTMFRLVYTCGLRPLEGRELKRAALNLETGEILISHTKHHKERVVVMSDDVLALCKEYEQHRKVFFPQSDFFFPNKDGNPYSTARAGSLFKQCWKLANPEISKEELPRVRLYDLRHRFASAVLNKWLDEGSNLYAKLPYLRAYMGHEDMSATAYYIHLLPENIVKSPGIEWDKLGEMLPEVE